MRDRNEISVVVPTRGRPAALARCVAALERQTVPVEVVVAEDDAGAGPAAARNAGWRRARGRIVLFTDDDCEPEVPWAEMLAAATEATGAAAGETVIANPRNRYAATSQALTSGLQRASLRADGTLGFAPTSNLGATRSVLERVQFDESFPAAAGEDRAWCARLEVTGIELRYQPGAVIRHHQELGARGFWAQQVRYGRGAARYRDSVGGLAGLATRTKLVAGAFRDGPAIGALGLAAQVAVATGYARERLAPGQPQR